MMYVFITIVIIIIGILLGLIVLIQNPKGGGLSGSFGGVGQQLLGARRSSDIIEKLTWGFAGGLLLLCILSTAFISKPTTTTNAVEKSAIETMEAKKPIPTPAPTQPGASQQPQPGASDPAAAPATQP